MNKSAQLISVILHPLLLTTYIVLVIDSYLPAFMMLHQKNKNLVIGLIFLFTFLFPVINLLLMRLFGTIDSIKLEERRQRIIPFTIVVFLYLMVTYLFFYKLPLSYNFNKLMVVVSIITIMSMIITLFYKISIHSIAVCGVAGILSALNHYAPIQEMLIVPMIGSIIISGIVMSSRLQLQAHSFQEVTYGGILGFLIGFIGISILF